MSHRDLTSNAPYIKIEDEEPTPPPVNPFASNDDLANVTVGSLESLLAFNAYSGIYSHNGSRSNLLSQNTSEVNLGPFSSQANMLSPSINKYDHPYSPSERDSYPLMNNSRLNTPSNSSEDSSNPFLSQVDYSPFGGYPTEAFPLTLDDPEADDYLHNPDPVKDAIYENNRFIHDLKNLDRRSLGGLVGLLAFAIGALLVFVVLPILTYSGITQPHVPDTYTILTKYQYPLLLAIRTSLIDPDTPADAHTRKVVSGDTWDLVFSDEFNVEGRTFYSGDDQFFTAPDLHYDATQDLEWYDPDAVTTANGTLQLRMDAFKNHDLFYRSGMVQSWNQMCFTQGLLEVSARLPNYGNITGLWPGIWTMGNLGRPGYLATTDGVWPYSYDSCDAGITANQSSPDGLSFLPGQRLNSCTCKGESHPNAGIGRGAPEIDAIEGEVSGGLGVASQSLQLAPMDIWYYPDYDFLSIYNSSVTTMNTYTGGPFQEALSAVTTLNTSWYQFANDTRNYQRYGFEYLNDNDNGHLTWYVGEDPTLTVHAQALHPNGNIGWRRLSKEPMSLIMNLGVSNSWAYIDWPSIHFPVTMSIDSVRVYQPPDQINLGCDPVDYPTFDYIQEHLNIYENVNLTSFKDGGYDTPKNSLLGC